jgi:cell division protein FtsL
MARNRRHQSAAIRFGPAVKAAALCLLIGGSAVGYVWQKDQIRQLGDQISRGEQSLKALRQKNEKLRRQLVSLRSPANLERLAEQHQLGLKRPSPDQVLRLPDPELLPLSSPGLPETRQYAATRTGPAGSYGQ